MLMSISNNEFKSTAINGSLILKKDRTTLAQSTIKFTLSELVESVQTDVEYIITLEMMKYLKTIYNLNPSFLSNTIVNYLSTVSSDVQTQINSINTLNTTQNTRLTTIEGQLPTSGFLSTLTSNAQTQLNAIVTVNNTQSTNITNLQNQLPSARIYNSNTGGSAGIYISHHLRLNGDGSTTPRPLVMSNYVYIQDLSNGQNANLFQKITFTTWINNITPTVFSYLANVSSDIQTQINNITSTGITQTSGDARYLNISKQSDIDILKSKTDFILTSNPVGEYFFFKNIYFFGPNINFTFGYSGDGQIVKFQNNSYILQEGSNVTNYLKNIEIASGCAINGINTTKLSYLTSLTEDTQTAINSLKTRTTTVETVISQTGLQFNSGNSYSYIINTVGIFLTAPNLYFNTSNIEFLAGTFQGLNADKFSYLSTVSENVQTAVNSLKNKTQYQSVIGNGTHFKSHIKTDGYSVILTEEYRDSSWPETPTLRFYDNCFIQQIGNSVTNYMKNIELASGCSLNGINTTKLGYLQNVSEDTQSAINSLKTRATNLETRATNLETTSTTHTTNISDIYTKLTTVQSVFRGQFTPSYIMDWTYISLTANITITHNLGYNETNNIPNFQILFKPASGSQVMAVSASSNQYEGFMIKSDSNVMRIKCGSSSLHTTFDDDFLGVTAHGTGYIKVFLYKSLSGIVII